MRKSFHLMRFFLLTERTEQTEGNGGWSGQSGRIFFRRRQTFFRRKKTPSAKKFSTFREKKEKRNPNPFQIPIPFAPSAPIPFAPTAPSAPSALFAQMSKSGEKNAFSGIDKFAEMTILCFPIRRGVFFGSRSDESNPKKSESPQTPQKLLLKYTIRYI